MVHNGIEYGLMAAYAEGSERPRKGECGRPAPRDRRGDHPAARPRVLPVRVRYRVCRRGLATRLGRRLLAARSDCGCACEIARARGVQRPGLGLGRRAVDAACRDRRGCSGARALGGPLRPLRVARGGAVRQPDSRRDALRVRRSRGEDGLDRVVNHDVEIVRDADAVAESRGGSRRNLGAEPRRPITAPSPSL